MCAKHWCLRPFLMLSGGWIPGCVWNCLLPRGFQCNIANLWLFGQKILDMPIVIVHSAWSMIGLHCPGPTSIITNYVLYGLWVHIHGFASHLEIVVRGILRLSGALQLSLHFEIRALNSLKRFSLHFFNGWSISNSIWKCLEWLLEDWVFGYWLVELGGIRSRPNVRCLRSDLLLCWN